MRATHLTSVILALAVHAGASAAIVVRFDPPVVNAEPNTPITIRLFADIPADQPIIGWGVKIKLTDDTLFRPFLGDTPAAISGTAFVGPTWFPAPNIGVLGFPFGQSPTIHVAGVSFPAPVTGNNILLAEVRLTGFRNGTSELLVFDERATGNNATGFALVPPKGFAAVTYRAARINIPAPSAAALLLSALIPFRRRRCA